MKIAVNHHIKNMGSCLRAFVKSTLFALNWMNGLLLRWRILHYGLFSPVE